MGDLRSTIKVDTQGVNDFLDKTKKARKEIIAIKKLLESKGFKGNQSQLVRAAKAYRREFLKAIKDIEKADLARIRGAIEAQKQLIQKDPAPTSEQTANLEELTTASEVLTVLATSSDESADSLEELQAALNETGEAATDSGEGFEDMDEAVTDAITSIADLKERNKEIKDTLENAPKAGEAGYEELKDLIAELTLEFSENRTEILEFNRGLRQGASETELASGSILELSQTVRRLTTEYNALGKEERKTAEGQELKNKIKSTREEVNKLRSELGDNRGFVGSYVQALESMGAPLGQAKQGVNAFSGALKLLLANPVVALLAAITAALGVLFGAWTSTKEGAEAMDRASAAVGATLDVLRDVAVTVAKALFSAFNDPLGSLKAFGSALLDNVLNRLKGALDIIFAVGRGIKALATVDMEGLRQASEDAATALVQVNTGLDADQQREFAQSVRDTANEIAREAAEAARLTGILQGLKDEERGLGVERAKLNTELIKARDRARDQNTPLAERIKLLKQIEGADGNLLTKEEANQVQRVAALQALAAQSDSNADTLDKLAQEEIKLERIRQRTASNTLTLNRQIRRLEQEGARERAREQKEEARQIEEIKKKREELLSVINRDNQKRAENLARFNEQIKRLEIAAIQDVTKRLLAEEEHRADQRKKAQESSFQDLITLQEQNLDKSLASDSLSAQEKKDLEDKTNAEILELTRSHNKLLQAEQTSHEAALSKIKADAAAKEEAARQAEIDATIAEQDAELAAEELVAKKTEEIRNKRAKAVAAAVQTAVQTSFDLINKIQQAAAAAENKAFEDAINARQSTIDSLQEQLNNATGVHAQFLEKQIEAERKAQEKLKRQAEQAAKDQAEAQRAIQLTQAIVNGALAVTNALGSAPPPANFILAGAVGAAAAVEIATIATQKFAKGGVIQGASHAKGGVPASVAGAANVELEGGEIVINKNSAQIYREELSEINAAGGGVRFQFGGDVSPDLEAVAVSDNNNDERFLNQMKKLKFFVNVTDISNLQEETAEVVNSSSI